MIEALTVRGLSKEYRTGGSTLKILSGTDLDLRRGESLAIVGRSGAGKSTLLHLLGLLDAPSSGSLSIDGVDVVKGGRRVRDRYRRDEIGFVFQFYHLLQELDALQNVLLSGMMGVGVVKWWGRRKAARRRAEELLERVGLGQRMHHVPAKLSGGERQRVAIARALFREPSLLLCDEPTGNLDEDTSDDVEKLILDLQGEGSMMMVLVTHNLRLARQLDRVQILEGGRLRDVEAKDEQPLPAGRSAGDAR